MATNATPSIPPFYGAVRRGHHGGPTDRTPAPAPGRGARESTSAERMATNATLSIPPFFGAVRRGDRGGPTDPTPAPAPGRGGAPRAGKVEQHTGW